MLVILAAVFSVLAIGLLYASWREVLPRAYAVPLGWFSLFVCLYLWVKAVGAEFGIIYGPLLLGFVAWVIVGMNYKTRLRAKKKETSYIQLGLPAARSFQLHGLTFLLVVPLAGLFSIFFSVLLSTVLPFSQLNSLVFSVLLMPFIWGLASYWVCASKVLLKPAVSMFVVTALCAGLIYG